MFYPAQFEKTDGGYSVTFKDIPEAITFGDSYDDAIAMAEDALATAMEFYFEDKRLVPPPSALQSGDVAIRLSASIAVKVLLLNEMVKQNISQVELANRLHVKRQTVGRMVDIKHTTKIDAIADALTALGKELRISI